MVMTQWKALGGALGEAVYIFYYMFTLYNYKAIRLKCSIKLKCILNNKPRSLAEVNEKSASPLVSE